MSIVHRYDFAAMTADAALDILADLDVAKWGETERDASRKMHSSKSRGLRINSIAHHQVNDYGDALTECELQTAKAQLTSADKAALRKGG